MHLVGPNWRRGRCVGLLRMLCARMQRTVACGAAGALPACDGTAGSPVRQAMLRTLEGGESVLRADVVRLRCAGAFGGGASTGAFGGGFGGSVAGGAPAAASFGFGASGTATTAASGFGAPAATSAPAFGAPAGAMHTQTHTLQRYIAHALTLTDATQQFVET
jgi:hypothetical protein